MGYWAWGEYPCHKSCKEEGYKQEAYLCQCIDADCNDCKFFQRGEYVKPPYKCFRGYCSKLNKPTVAFAVTATNHECFVHRKS